jgi:hypothetical protein
VIDFMKIVQEYCMLDFFTTKEEISSLIEYIGRKFVSEIDLER